jgi:cytochrome c oxidase subunit 2
MDAVPGMTTKLRFKALEKGRYDVLCAEYCGVAHSGMLSAVEVVGKDEFDAWYARSPQTAKK